MNSTMVTSGTMSNREDQLVKAKLVERAPNPSDARVYCITNGRRKKSYCSGGLSELVDTQN
ncbi:hypothetical protein [Aliikangiella sp. IMCC44359]|uniref:hypothetical protein n=1 Tax=Aliikangiella sp. IMCC44359 TaxID=3459125 RepID=UPI00403B0DAF